MIDVTLYTLFFCLPCLYVVVFQWFASTTSILWYQVSLSWVLPTFYIVVLIHPIRRIYQQYIMSIVNIDSQRSCVRHAIKIILGDENMSFYLWPCLMICLSVIEILCNTSRNSTITTVFTTIFYTLTFGVLLFLFVFVISVDHITYTDISTQSSLCTDDRDTNDIKQSEQDSQPMSHQSTDAVVELSVFWPLFSFSCVAIGYVILSWITLSDSDSTKLFIITMYVVFCVIIAIMLSFNVYYQYLKRKLNLIQGMVTYVISFCMTLSICTLFTMAYNFYLNDGNADIDVNETTILFLLYMLFLFVSQLLYQASEHALKQMSSAFLHKQYLYPQLLWSYVCQFAIFGFTPISWQLIVLNVIATLHQILRSMQIYTWIWRNVCCFLCKSSDSDHKNDAKYDEINVKYAKLFESTAVILSDRQLYSQEWLCVIQTLVSLTSLIYWFRWYGINSNFTNRFLSDDVELALSISIQFSFRFVSWIITSFIIRQRLQESDCVG